MATLDFSRLIATPMWSGSQDGTNGGTFNSTGYVYNSYGSVVGLRFAAASSALEKVYFYLESGSATVNAGPLVEIRNWNTTTSNDPGTTLLDSTRVTFLGNQKWHTATFSPVVSMTVGTHYWVVIAGESTDNFDFVTDVSDADTSFLTGYSDFFTDTTGWTGGSIVGDRSPIVLKFSDGTIFGNPYANQSATLSTTDEYGIKINPLKTGLQITNILMDNIANLETIRVYRGSSNPGSPERIITPSALPLANGWFGFAPIVLESSTTYRITFKYSTSVTPTKLVANNATIEDVLNCGIFGGKMHLTLNSGGLWEDHREMFPLLRFAIKGFDNVD